MSINTPSTTNKMHTNKMRYKILTAGIVVFASVSFAQSQRDTTSVNRSVMVERDFQPVIQDAGKIISLPKEIEPVVEKTNPSYADFTTPIDFNDTLSMLMPEKLQHKPYDVKSGFLRLGIGYPLNTIADLMYPILKNENNMLDLSLHHLGAFGDKNHSKTSLKLQYDHLFDNFGIYAGIGGMHEHYNYYGRWFGINRPFILSEIASQYGSSVYRMPNGSDISLYNISAFPLNETNWRINTNVGVKSLPATDGLEYKAELQYNVFKAVKVPVNENHLRLKGAVEVPFDDNRLGMKLEINNMNYSADDTAAFRFPDSYSVIKFNPYFKMIGYTGFIKLGVKTGIASNHGQVFTPSPDVEAQWNAIHDYLAIYGGVTGDLQLSTLDYTYNQNRYLHSPLRLNDVYTPIDAYGGIKFKPAYNFLFDIFGSYKIIDRQYFFINREFISQTAPEDNLAKIYQNRFDVVYADANHATAGLRADYNYKKQVHVYLKGAYHYWDVSEQQYAWQMPEFDIDFGANVQIMNNTNIFTQIFFQDGKYAKLGDRAVKMTPTLDINIGASYIYNDRLSLFIKLNNLLNKHYDIYYGYEVQGINATIGATVSF